MKKKKDNLIGVVSEVEAIDFTPIYYIRLVKGVKAGQRLVWDSATREVYLVKNISKL